MTEPVVGWKPHDGPQRAFLESSAFEVLYGGAAGGGKALDVSTLVPTPYGWERMGDLAVGSRVFDEKGQVCTVWACSEVMSGRPCYRVEFSDGSWVVADADHRWLTFNREEREALGRRAPEFRARRRERRASRALGRRSEAFTAAVTARNKALPPATLPPPSGTVRTTVEIRDSLTTPRRGDLNHAIPVAGPLDLPAADLPLDPYVLGAWLGDGNSSGHGITCDQNEPWIVEEIARAGFQVTKWSGKHTWGVRGLVTPLRQLGLVRNKHIPRQYLRSSHDQRIALLQGLMDTDGTVDARGHLSWSNTNRRLVRDVFELAASLGFKVTARASWAVLNGRRVGVTWDVRFAANEAVFRLPRKLARQQHRIPTAVTRRRYITAVTAVPSRPVRCIAVDSPSRLFLVGRSMIPTHNSDALLYGSLRYVHRPKYRALILRQTFPQLRELMDRSHLSFKELGAHWIAADKRWRFPSGAFVEFGYAETYKEALQYQGQEYQYIGFDELGLIAEERVWTFLMTRCRTTDPEILRFMRASANPGGAGHGWLKRRFVRPCPVDGSPYFVPGVVDENGNPLTRAFIRARVWDNPTLVENDPQYIAQLRSLPEGMRMQLLEGNWESGTGMAFEHLDESVHLVPYERPDPHATVFAGFDWGYGHNFAVGLYMVERDGSIVKVDTVSGRKLIPEQIVERVSETFAAHGVPFSRLLYTVAGSDVKTGEMARGNFGPSIHEQFFNHGWVLMQADQRRVTGYQNFLQYLDHDTDHPPKLRIMRTPGNLRFWEQLQEMVVDPDAPNDVLKVDADPVTGEGGDDLYDEGRYSLMSRPIFRLPKQADPRETPDQSSLKAFKPRKETGVPWKTTMPRIRRAVGSRTEEV